MKVIWRPSLLSLALLAAYMLGTSQKPARADGNSELLQVAKEVAQYQRAIAGAQRSQADSLRELTGSQERQPRACASWCAQRSAASSEQVERGRRARTQSRLRGRDQAREKSTANERALPRVHRCRLSPRRAGACPRRRFVLPAVLRSTRSAPSLAARQGRKLVRAPVLDQQSALEMQPAHEEAGALSRRGHAPDRLGATTSSKCALGRERTERQRDQTLPRIMNEMTSE